jgi:hypothetical protein
MRYSVRFYYGNLGTTLASRSKNQDYSSNEQPISLVHFYAAMSVITLVFIYGTALFNCLFVHNWVKQ